MRGESNALPMATGHGRDLVTAEPAAVDWALINGGLTVDIDQVGEVADIWILVRGRETGQPHHRRPGDTDGRHDAAVGQPASTSGT